MAALRRATTGGCPYLHITPERPATCPNVVWFDLGELGVDDGEPFRFGNTAEALVCADECIQTDTPVKREGN